MIKIISRSYEIRSEWLFDKTMCRRDIVEAIAVANGEEYFKHCKRKIFNT
jgi:hypothetical protein